MYFYCSNYVGNQLTIAIRQLGFVICGQYTAAKGCVKALCVAWWLRKALSCVILAIYTHPPSWSQDSILFELLDGLNFSIEPRVSLCKEFDWCET